MADVSFSKQSQVAFPVSEQKRKRLDPDAMTRVQKRQPRRRKPPRSVDLAAMQVKLKENV